MVNEGTFCSLVICYLITVICVQCVAHSLLIHRAVSQYQHFNSITQAGKLFSFSPSMSIERIVFPFPVPACSHTPFYKPSNMKFDTMISMVSFPFFHSPLHWLRHLTCLDTSSLSGELSRLSDWIVSLPAWSHTAESGFKWSHILVL